VTARSLRRSLIALAGMAIAMLGTTAETENAVANGDTRALTIYHTHTQESATIVFKRDGRYDRAALDQLNWLLRDWRINEPTKMDPRLFDTVWEAYRQVGSTQPINIVSAYRSPGTNAMLRRRSKMVAEYSQHMLGKAMDFYLTDVPIDRIREVGFQMSRGGVGWYPHANTPFIHMDVGSVRSWPRMSRDQLARLFPDGRTVHLPPDGHPLAGYEEAKAEILSRGGTVAGITTQLVSAEDEDSPGLMDFLAGLFKSSPQPVAVATAPPPSPRRERQAPVVSVASADPDMPISAKAPLAYAAPPVADAPAMPIQGNTRGLLTAGPGAAAAAAAEEAMPAVVAPLPPRRPAEAAIVAAAALAMPLPPPRPAQLASLDGGMANLAVPAPVARAAPAPVPVPPKPPALRASLVKPDADAKLQLRSLFDAVAMGSVAAPASRNTPVHLATARAVATAPDKAIATGPEPVTTRFLRAVPDAAQLGDRFTGSAASLLRSSQ
jgi:uncharacterized protein YcbK (DUF882 family)